MSQVRYYDQPWRKCPEYQAAFWAHMENYWTLGRLADEKKRGTPEYIEACKRRDESLEKLRQATERAVERYGPTREVKA